MERIKTLIVDDHPLVRRALVELVGEAEALEVVGEASNGDEATAISNAIKPDLVLMDLHMPRCDGVEATGRLQAELPKTRVLILTVSEKEEDLFAAVKAGARGYILKNSEPEMILQAIQYVARGGIVVSPEMAARLSNELGGDEPRSKETTLTSREENILKLLALGESDEEIAARLDVRESWIGFLLSNIMQKLGVNDRTEVVDYANRSLSRDGDKDGATVATSEGDETEPVPARVTQGEEAAVLAHEPREVGTGPADPPVAAEGNTVMGMVELVISPPLEPIQVLKLHKWLADVVDGHLWEVHPSLRGDTVVQINIRRPSPLVRLLQEMPLVAEVTEEPYEEPYEEEQDAEQAPPRRVRLVLEPV